MWNFLIPDEHGNKSSVLLCSLSLPYCTDKGSKELWLRSTVVFYCLNEFFVCHCRYQGPLLEEGALDSAVSRGAASPEYTKLCAWIVSELRLYCKLEENVHATNCKTHF